MLQDLVCLITISIQFIPIPNKRHQGAKMGVVILYAEHLFFKLFNFFCYSFGVMPLENVQNDNHYIAV
jgi:hypothetical protein